MRLISKLLMPPKIKALSLKFTLNDSFRILDVGCGNDSPSNFKYYFKNCLYDGLDIQEYNISEQDKKLMNNFFIINSNTPYSSVLSYKYDAIVLNHVIEHMHDSNERLIKLCSYLNSGGIIYLAFPSIESLSFPSADGTLNFCDDSSHVFIPSIREISNILIKNNIKIQFAGRKRDWIRSVIAVPLFLYQITKKILFNKMNARGLWSLYKFEASIIGIKK